MKKFFSYIVGGIIGLAISAWLFPEVKITVLPNSNFFGFALTQPWEVVVLLGILLGLLTFFVKPILKKITLPLRIITLGLFNFIIDLALVWILDLIFEEVTIPWFWPLFWTTVIIFIIDLILQIAFKNSKATV